MPVYKITEQKLAKRKREDEDGTTELKEALGLADEGSESESEGSSSGSSDEEEDSDGESEEDEDEEDVKHQDDEDSDESSSEGDSEDEVDAEIVQAEGSGSDSESESEDEGEGSGSSSDEESKPRTFQSKHEIPIIPGEKPMSVDQVSTNPIYPLPDRPTASGCILCPTKTMKTEKMVGLHLKSGAHIRSMKRWEKALKDWAKPKRISHRPDDPRAIVAIIYRDLATKQAREDAHLKAKVQAKVVARKARKEVKKAAKLADRAANPRPVKQPKILSEKDQAAHDARKARKKAEKMARQADKKRRKEEREQLRQQAVAEGHVPGNANSVPVGGQRWGGGGVDGGVSRTWMGGSSGGYGAFGAQAKKRSSPRMIRKRAKEAKLIAMGIDPHAKTGDDAMSRKQKKHLKKQEKKEKQAMRRAGVRLQKQRNQGGRNG